MNLLNTYSRILLMTDTEEIKESLIKSIIHDDEYTIIDMDHRCIENINNSDIDNIVIDLNKSKLTYKETKLYASKFTRLDTNINDNKKILFISKCIDLKLIDFLDPVFDYIDICDFVLFERNMKLSVIKNRLADLDFKLPKITDYLPYVEQIK